MYIVQLMYGFPTKDETVKTNFQGLIKYSHFMAFLIELGQVKNKFKVARNPK